MTCDRCWPEQVSPYEFAKLFELRIYLYNDAPYSGWATCRVCGASYAFSCAATDEDAWEWTLVPTEGIELSGTNFEKVFTVARQRRAPWLRVTERRSPEGSIHHAEIRRDTIPPAIWEEEVTP